MHHEQCYERSDRYRLLADRFSLEMIIVLVWPASKLSWGGHPSGGGQLPRELARRLCSYGPRVEELNWDSLRASSLGGQARIGTRRESEEGETLVKMCRRKKSRSKTLERSREKSQEKDEKKFGKKIETKVEKKTRKKIKNKKTREKSRERVEEKVEKKVETKFEKNVEKKVGKKSRKKVRKKIEKRVEKKVGKKSKVGKITIGSKILIALTGLRANRPSRSCRQLLRAPSWGW